MLRREKEFDKTGAQVTDADWHDLTGHFFTLAAHWLGLTSDCPKPRTVIAKWVKEHGLKKTMAAVASASRAGPVEAISFITKYLISTEDKPLTTVSKADRLAYVAWAVKGHFHELSGPVITPAEIKACIRTGLLTKDEADGY